MRLLKFVFATAGLFLLVAPVHAVTFSVLGESGGTGFTTSSTADTVTFNWGADAPGSIFVSFTTLNEFSLSLDSFSGDNGGGSRMQLRNGGGMAIVPSPAPSGFSVVTPKPLNDLAADIGGAINAGGAGLGLVFSPGASGELFASLGAGTYYLGFQEPDGAPANGSVTFSVSQVPVPAAGLLFGSALMGAAALRRRKSAQAAA